MVDFNLLASTSHPKPRGNVPVAAESCKCGGTFRVRYYKKIGLVIYACPMGNFQRNLQWRQAKN